MSSALESVLALAREFRALDHAVTGAAGASDHDPSWSDADDVQLRADTAKRDACEHQLLAAFDALDRDHPAMWRAYLADMAKRLAALARYQRRPAGDTRLTARAFASDLATLHEHRKTIDALLRAGR